MIETKVFQFKKEFPWNLSSHESANSWNLVGLTSTPIVRHDRRVQKSLMRSTGKSKIWDSVTGLENALRTALPIDHEEGIQKMVSIAAAFSFSIFDFWVSWEFRRVFQTKFKIKIVSF